MDLLLYPRKKKHRYPLNRRLARPQGHSGQFQRGKNLCSSQKSNPHCTAHSLVTILTKLSQLHSLSKFLFNKVVVTKHYKCTHFPFVSCFTALATVLHYIHLLLQDMLLVNEHIVQPKLNAYLTTLQPMTPIQQHPAVQKPLAGPPDSVVHVSMMLLYTVPHNTHHTANT